MLWDVLTGRFIRSFYGMLDYRYSFYYPRHYPVITGDGNAIIFTTDAPPLSRNTLAIIWNINDRLPEYSIDLGPGQGGILAIPLTNSPITLFCDGSTLKYFDYTKRQVIKSYQFDRDLRSPVIFDNDTKLAAITDLYRIDIVDLTNGQITKSVRHNIEYISSITISVDGKYIIAAPSYGNVTVWDTNSRKLAFTFDDVSMPYIAVNKDNILTIVDNGHKTVYYYDLNHMELIHKAYLSCAISDFVFSSNNEMLILCMVENAIWAYNTYPPAPLRPLFLVRPTNVRAKLSHYDSLLLVLTYSSSFSDMNKCDGFSVYEASTGREIVSNTYTNSSISDAAISASGSQLAIAFANGDVRVLDLQAKLIGVADTLPLISTYHGTNSQSPCIEFSPTEPVLAIAHQNGIITLFNWRQGTVISNLNRTCTFNDSVRSITYSDNGATIAVSCRFSTELLNNNGVNIYCSGGSQDVHFMNHDKFLLEMNALSLLLKDISSRHILYQAYLNNSQWGIVCNNNLNAISIDRRSGDWFLFDLTDTSGNQQRYSIDTLRPHFNFPRHAIGTHDGKSVIIIGEDNSIQRFDLNFSTVGIASPPAYSNATSFTLDAPYPNPTGGSVQVNYSLQHSMLVSIKVHDNLGRIVQTVQAPANDPGTHTATLDVSGFSPGVYFIVMQSGMERVARSIVVER